MNVVQGDAFAIVDWSNRRIRSESCTKDPLAGTRCQVLLRTPPCVIPVGVRDYRAFHGEPGIDMEITGLAIQSAVGRSKQQRKAPGYRESVFSTPTGGTEVYQPRTCSAR
jgi:hypothetical protein